MVWSLSPQCPVTTDRSRPLTGQTEAKTKLRGRGRAGRRCVVRTASSDPPVTGGRHSVVTRHAVTQGQARTPDKVTRAAMEAGTIVRVIKVRHNMSSIRPGPCNAVSGVQLMHFVVRYRGHHHGRESLPHDKTGPLSPLGPSPGMFREHGKYVSFEKLLRTMDVL